MVDGCCDWDSRCSIWAEVFEYPLHELAFDLLPTSIVAHAKTSHLIHGKLDQCQLVEGLSRRQQGIPYMLLFFFGGSEEVSWIRIVCLANSLVDFISALWRKCSLWNSFALFVDPVRSPICRAGSGYSNRPLNECRSLLMVSFLLGCVSLMRRKVSFWPWRL